MKTPNVNTPRRRPKPLASTLVLLVAACSADPSDLGVDAETEEPSEMTDDPQPHASLEDFDTSQGSSLTFEEEQAITSYLGDIGVAAGDLSFFGRLVGMQGDGYWRADDLLEQARPPELLEKGKVLTQLVLGSSFPNCSVATCGDSAPAQYAFGTLPPENLAFRRPDTTKTYYLVVDDAAPSFFTNGTGGGMVGQAASAVTSANQFTDCLSATLFDVRRNASYQSLPLATRQANYRIRITFGEFGSACANSAVGCSNFPRFENVTVGGVSQSRLAFGNRIALVTVPLVEPSTALTQLNEYSVGIMTHELLHAMGLGHPQRSSGEERTVPGTADGTTHPSIMHATTIGDASYRATPQADDRLVLRKLYGQDAQGNCPFNPNFQTITP